MARGPRQLPLAIGLLLALVACGERAPAADPDRPAGEVVELSGEVTAARPGGGPRSLRQGDPVHADDTITTGPGAAAVIRLAHNKVTWNLGPSQSRRVDASLAWKASAQEGASAFAEEGELVTASAGRHTEREAGDTAATALEPESGAAPPAPPASAPEPTVPRAPPASRRDVTAKSARKRESARSLEAAQSPPADAVVSGPLGGKGGASGEGAASVESAVRAQPLEESAAAPGSAPAPEPADRAEPERRTRGQAARTASLGVVSVSGPRPQAQVTRALRPLASRCSAGAAGVATLRLSITAEGAVGKVRLDAPAALRAEVSRCLLAAARATRLPAHGGGATTVQLELRWGP